VQKMDGMTYAPISLKNRDKVVKENDFRFSVIGLDHGHIFAMTNGLLEAGATIVAVYDEDKRKLDEFLQRYPQAGIASSIESILDDPSIQLIASAIIPSKRSILGIKALKSGKHFFSDKPGMLTLEEVSQVEMVCKSTHKRYFIYFGERIHVEGALYTQQLIEQGKLGRILSVTILAPHRLNKASRPNWFFNPKENGGILIDIGSHQLEQFLTYTGAEEVEILHSSVANYNNPEHPEFFDFGHCTLLADNGAVCYFRVDWFTPDGLGAWGDGRVFVVGTKGTIEIRKYLDIAQSETGDQVYFVDGIGEHHIETQGIIGYPFFGDLILDCLHNTEKAITQAHTLQVMRLAIKAQNKALIIYPTK